MRSRRTPRAGAPPPRPAGPAAPLLAETIDYVGAEHLIYASDVPHWDGEFPANLEHLRGLNSISRADKEKILYGNSKAFFRV